eukprot:13763828-Alexandrium_andersonii.AAC.1
MRQRSHHPRNVHNKASPSCMSNKITRQMIQPSPAHGLSVCDASVFTTLCSRTGLGGLPPRRTPPEAPPARAGGVLLGGLGGR